MTDVALEFDGATPARDVLSVRPLELIAEPLHITRIHAGPSVAVRAIRRTIDIVGALVLILVTLPVMVVVVLAVVAEDRKSPIFRQERVGLRGRPFTIFKFRTMRPNAEQFLETRPDLHEDYVAHGWKLPNGTDPRITKVGNLLRKASLDELPQLFNVLSGSMSLIGPRPVLGHELKEYGSGAGQLLAIRPGMTGYWQTHGRSKIHYPERANMDIWYVQNRSFAVDIRIVGATTVAVLRRDGAC